MLNVVDEIEAELKQITAPPYVLFHDRGIWSVLPAGRPGEVYGGFKHEPDAQFYRASPERLAALCRYVRANEELLATKERVIEVDEHGVVHRSDDALQSVRRELGLGKE